MQIASPLYEHYSYSRNYKNILSLLSHFDQVRLREYRLTDYVPDLGKFSIDHSYASSPLGEWKLHLRNINHKKAVRIFHVFTTGKSKLLSPSCYIAPGGSSFIFMPTPPSKALTPYQRFMLHHEIGHANYQNHLLLSFKYTGLIGAIMVGSGIIFYWDYSALQAAGTILYIACCTLIYFFLSETFDDELMADRFALTTMTPGDVSAINKLLKSKVLTFVRDKKIDFLRFSNNLSDSHKLGSTAERHMEAMRFCELDFRDQQDSTASPNGLLAKALTSNRMRWASAGLFVSLFFLPPPSVMICALLLIITIVLAVIFSIKAFKLELKLYDGNRFLEPLPVSSIIAPALERRKDIDLPWR